MFGNNIKLEKFNWTKFDFTNLEELNPSCKNFKLIKNISINTEIHILNDNDRKILKDKEPIDFKLYKKSDGFDFKLELISDSDIFFFYGHK